MPNHASIHASICHIRHLLLTTATTTIGEIFHNTTDRWVEDEHNHLRIEMGDRRNDFYRREIDNRHHHGFYQRGNNGHGWWGGAGAYTPKDLEGIPSWDGNPAK